MSEPAPIVPNSVEDMFRRYGRPYRTLVTIAGMTATFTMVLTGTIVNVAVPDVMGAYGVGQDKAQLLTTAFVVAMTASQLLNAWVVAVLGQRIGFCTTLVLFAIGSLICGISPNLDMIIFGRVLQGAAAGVIQPLVMVTIFQVFPSNRRGFALGLFAMGLVLALGLGPVVGGITIDATSWRQIFYVPLPLVGIAFLMGAVFMPSVRQATPPAFDWTGYALLIVALYCVMTAIASGQREGWVSDYIVTLIVVGAVSGGLFVVSQARAAASLMDLSLFRNPQFLSAVIIAFIFGMGNFATTYAIPVFGQIVQGYTPTAAGVLLLPASLVVVVMLPFTGRMTDRVPLQYPIFVGLLIFALGAILMAGADVNTPYWSMVFFAAVSRFGMAFMNPALNAAALRSVEPDRLNAGAGALNFCRQLGGATGTNAWVAILELRTQLHSDALTATQTSDNVASREMIEGVGRILGQAGVTESQQMPGALHYLGQVVHAQANTLGFQDGFLIIAVVFFIAMVPAFVIGRGQVQKA